MLEIYFPFNKELKYITLYIFKNYTSYLIIHKLIKKCICHSLFSKGKELDVDKERSGKVLRIAKSTGCEQEMASNY